MTEQQHRTMHPDAARRILRLSLGTALCLLVTQLAGFPLAFVAAVLTSMILSMPMPAPSLKMGVGFVLALLAPMFAGLLLLPFLEHARWVGIGLVALGLWYSFYFTARGGSPILGTFMTVGLTVVVTIGSVSSSALIALLQGLALCAIFAMGFVWVAYALLPEPPRPPRKSPPAPTRPATDASEAYRQTLRSWLLVFPLAMIFMFISASTSYTPVMIKVASMGQEASAVQSRALAKSLIRSTFWGGVGAIIAFHLLGVWTSLVFYTLLVALAGLIYGRYIFQGPARHPDAAEASYAYLTMLVILGPALMGNQGDAASAFYFRLLLFFIIAIYGGVAVTVFDAFWPAENRSGKQAQELA